VNNPSDAPGANDLTGVVLAAGFGSRLAGASGTTCLKPLTPVCGKPLMSRTLTSLSVAGCTRVVIVVGHGSNSVRDFAENYVDVPLDVEIVENDRYDLSNGVSVLAAAPHVSGHFLLTMADHVFSDDVMKLAGAHSPPSDGATLLVDHKLNTIFDMDDATKVLSDGSVGIREIGKNLSSFDCVDTGLFVCSSGLLVALEDVYSRKGDVSLSDGVSELARRGKMQILDIGDGFWQDVDTPEMLSEAERRLRLIL
jgi:choline kinase